jgi:hypothetical protein
MDTPVPETLAPHTVKSNFLSVVSRLGTRSNELV